VTCCDVARTSAPDLLRARTASRSSCCGMGGGSPPPTPGPSATMRGCGPRPGRCPLSTRRTARICGPSMRPSRGCAPWSKTCGPCWTWSRYGRAPPGCGASGASTTSRHSPSRPSWATRPASRRPRVSWPLSAWSHPSIPAAPSNPTGRLPRPATPICAACSWKRRGPTGINPFVGQTLARRQCGAPADVVAHAWTAQQRLHRRYARFAARGKPRQHIVTAVARELTGFLWAALVPSADRPSVERRILGRSMR